MHNSLQCPRLARVLTHSKSSLLLCSMFPIRSLLSTCGVPAMKPTMIPIPTFHTFSTLVVMVEESVRNGYSGILRISIACREASLSALITLSGVYHTGIHSPEVEEFLDGVASIYLLFSISLSYQLFCHSFF